METILRLLPALACPIVMGLMMWMLSRNNNGNNNATGTTTDTQMHSRQRLPVAQEPQRAPAANTSPIRAIVDMIKCCFNPKVIAGLAVVGVGVLVFAPSLAASALPALLVLACPLSMLFMMRGMNRGMGGQSANRDTQQQQTHEPVVIDQVPMNPSAALPKRTEQALPVQVTQDR